MRSWTTIRSAEKMPPSLTVSIVALVTSLTSVGVSIYFGLRDRPKVKTSCTLYPPYDENPVPRLFVRLVNAGRRPVIIRLFGGTFGKDGWQGTYLNEGKGLRLGEHEFYEQTISPDDQDVLFSHEDSEAVQELWFEDSLGQRHPVKNSRKLLKEFWRLK